MCAVAIPRNIITVKILRQTIRNNKSVILDPAYWF
jgi:hypothetical protein